MEQPISVLGNVDWVEARAACSASKVFQIVCLAVKADMEKRNAQLNLAIDKYDSHYDGTGDFIAFRKTPRTHRIYRFHQTANGIRVSDDIQDNKTLAEATLTLGDDGQCRLRLADKELEFWQFRRKVLEDFLFEPMT
jgi:hypothetical protein